MLLLQSTSAAPERLLDPVNFDRVRLSVKVSKLRSSLKSGQKFRKENANFLRAPDNSDFLEVDLQWGKPATTPSNRIPRKQFHEVRSCYQHWRGVTPVADRTGDLFTPAPAPALPTRHSQAWLPDLCTRQCTPAKSCASSAGRNSTAIPQENAFAAAVA